MTIVSALLIFVFLVLYSAFWPLKDYFQALTLPTPPINKPALQKTYLMIFGIGYGIAVPIADEIYFRVFQDVAWKEDWAAYIISLGYALITLATAYSTINGNIIALVFVLAYATGIGIHLISKKEGFFIGAGVRLGIAVGILSWFVWLYYTNDKKLVLERKNPVFFFYSNVNNLVYTSGALKKMDQPNNNSKTANSTRLLL